LSRAAQSVLLYDEDCGFYRWSLDKILAWDRRKRYWFGARHRFLPVRLLRVDANCQVRLRA